MITRISIIIVLVLIYIYGHANEPTIEDKSPWDTYVMQRIISVFYN